MVSRLKTMRRGAYRFIILEIGAGSGKAIELLVPYGCNIPCVEPGPDLVRLGKNKYN